MPQRMEATICSSPDIPTVPERQATKLPDAGSPTNKDDYKKFRRAIMAGIITSPQGALGTANTAKPTLG